MKHIGTITDVSYYTSESGAISERDRIKVESLTNDCDILGGSYCVIISGRTKKKIIYKPGKRRIYKDEI